MCSTPEGMGAATTRRSRRHNKGARRAVLNARGHGSGDDQGLRSGRGRGRDVLNARGHGSGDDRPPPRVGSRNRRVLNARGHGSGDDIGYAGEEMPPVIDGAQRPRAWERRRLGEPGGHQLPDDVCSTPEGMGAATTGEHTGAVIRCTPVLNARGHGSGDDPRLMVDKPSGIYQCSTPEGMGAATTRGQRSHFGQDDVAVLNARGHGSGDDRPGGRARNRQRAECSTPEGMGAATTRRSETRR